MEQDNEEPPIFLHFMIPNLSGHPPFYVTLKIEVLLFHNYMVDIRTNSNVMPLKIMERLG